MKYAAPLPGFFLLLLLASPAIAQQGQAQPGADAASSPASLKLQPAQITAAATQAMMLATAKAGRRIVAVGDHGIVLLSDDNGAHFRQAKSVPARATLTAVTFVDGKVGWAVGHWGVVLKTSDGGETWEVQRTDTSVDRPLFSVSFKDKDNGMAVGLWSLVLVTRDGGKTWNTVRIPAPPEGGKADRNLLKVFTNRRGQLFVAAEQGTVLRSDDEGTNWTYLNTGYKGTFWTGIVLKDGTLLVGGLRGTIYRSIDEGRSWQQSHSGVKSSITDFGEIDGKVFAVGLDGVVLESGDNGATFKATQRDDRLPFTALAIADNGRPVVFSKRGVVEEARIDSH